MGEWAIIRRLLSTFVANFMQSHARTCYIKNMETKRSVAKKIKTTFISGGPGGLRWLPISR
jgi:hypothetical protein